MAIEPIKGFYVHDESTDTDGVTRYDAGSLDGLDETVSLAGYAPDAKAVGDALERSDVSDFLSNTTISENIGIWANGYVREDGSLGSATNICRNVVPLCFSGSKVKVSVPTGYKIQMYEYLAAPPSNYNGIVQTYSEGDVTIFVNSSNYYLFTLMKTDESRFTPSDIPSDSISVAYIDLYENLFVNKKADFLHDLSVFGSATITKDMIVSKSALQLTVSSLIKISKGDIVTFEQGSNVKTIRVQVLDSNMTSINQVVKNENATIEITSVENGYIRIYFERLNQSTSILPSEFDAIVTVKTRKTNAQRLVIHMEKGSYDGTEDRYGGPLSNWSERMINKYPIVLNGANTVCFRNVVSDTPRMNVFFRDANGGAISETQLTANLKDNYLSIPSTAYYIDIQVVYSGLYDIVADFWNDDTDKMVEEQKRIYTNSNSPTVNYFSVDWEDNLYSAMCYMLPPNYTNNGEKVPVALWFDGNTGYSQIGGRFSSAKMPGLQYLRDEGFAVLQIFSWGSYYNSKYPNCGADQPYPTPTCLKCIKEGLEYFLDRYNVDADNVHVVSKSMGGLISLYFVSNPIHNFKSIGMFSPILDMFGLRGRYPAARRAIFEDLDFIGDVEEFADIDFNGDTQTGVPNYYFSERCCQNTWENNKTKLLKLNPAWLDLIGDTFENNYLKAVEDARAWYADMYATGIYDNDDYKKIGKIPIKIWAAKDDDNVPYQAMPEIISQLQNAGAFAEISTKNSGGHSAFDVGTTYALDGETALGIEFSNIPNGWVEFVEFARANSRKPVGTTIINA